MITTKPASAEFFVSWRSSDAAHRDWRFFPKLDPWRDSMPGDLKERLRDSDGDLVVVELGAEEGVPDGVSPRRRGLPRTPVVNAFHRRHLHGPYDGRFYPRGVLSQISGAGALFSQDRHPFRVLRLEPDRVEVDLGHPLGGTPLTVGGRVSEQRDSKEERGGSCNDVLADLVESGPGMQCPPVGGRVDFEQADAFAREDAAPDDAFYDRPRMVQHIDGRARACINQAYRKAIEPGDRVLDLMSSWVSHLDGTAPQIRVTGLGMNEEELKANARLEDSLVQDLNREPRLPWSDGEFDVAVCTVSVEYLTRPHEVFAEVARVLRPGGRFVVTFSDRWFPPKVIRLWTLLHPFERMGLVLDYFRRSGQFGELETESWTGWPRPEDDKYYRVMLNSDPVFVVRGARI
ncbi:MAG: class I SAM-dependent methyltransferase [Gammaproteobacteria bacterium]|jgi:SAM-dependent methyltransferase|nr:class I SAM-dependent methyltransferase [Gammaproteobacteria bacterium]